MEKYVKIEVINKLKSTDAIYRSILVILVTSCVLGFLGAWNSFEFSWMHKRMHVLNELIENRDSVEKYIANPKNKINIKSEIPISKLAEHYKNLGCNKVTLVNAHRNLNKVFNENYVMIKVPFFGVVFDVNDLAIFCGIGYIMILYLFLYYTNLRRSNLSEAMFIAENTKDPELRYGTYRLISMFQTFSTAKNKNEFSFTPYLAKLSNSLFLFPAIIYTIIVGYDIYTRDIGINYLNSMGKTIFTLAVSGFFGLIIYVLTFFVKESSNEYNNVCKELTIKLNKTQKPLIP